MAKIVKRRKRRLSLEGIAILFFTACAFAFVVVTLFTNTYNASLTIKIQKLNNELEVLKGENQNLNFEIQSLENKDRVYVIAQAANLTQTQDNIVSVTGE